MERRMNWSDMAEVYSIKLAFRDEKAQCAQRRVGPRSKFATGACAGRARRVCPSQEFVVHSQKWLCYLQEMRLAVGCSHVFLPAAGELSGSRLPGRTFL